MEYSLQQYYTQIGKRIKEQHPTLTDRIVDMQIKEVIELWEQLPELEQNFF